MDQLTEAQARERLLSSISQDELRRHLEHIANRIPSRAAGSPNERRMAEYSRDQLLRSGADDARVHEIPALVSFPGPAEVLVEGADPLHVQANTLGHAAVTPPEGVHGPLVYLATGTAREFEATDVRGKIVLTELGYAPARHEKQRLAMLHGAAGCVMMNWGPDGSTALPYGSVKPGWGTATLGTPLDEIRTLPCVGVSRAAGLMLRRLCGSPQVTVRLRGNVSNEWRAVHVTAGSMRAGESGDFVLVGGHQDSWPGPAATDNAAGSACLLELARVFSANRSSLRRGLRFCFWTAHETGTMAGSSWYADRHWDEQRDHACAFLQLYQPACVGATEWETASNVELRAMHEAVESQLLADVPRRWRRIVRNGDASFLGLGLPMMHGQGAFTEGELAATANASLGWWHHSDQCTLDKVDTAWLVRHAQAYAAYLWELCSSPILPLRISPLASQVVRRLRELEPCGREVELARVRALAETVLDQADGFDARVDEARRRFANGPVDAREATRLDGALKALSRILNPVLYCASGRYVQDSYGHSALDQLLPGLHALPRLEQTRAEDQHAILLTTLVRQRNRVSDALQEARVRMAEALS